MCCIGQCTITFVCLGSSSVLVILAILFRLVLRTHPAIVNARDPSTGTSLLQLVVQSCPNTKVLAPKLSVCLDRDSPFIPAIATFLPLFSPVEVRTFPLVGNVPS